MARLPVIAWVLVAGAAAAFQAAAYDRVASIAELPFSAESGSEGPHGRLVDLVRALDKATHSSTKIVLRPIGRSLKETAAGLADFHLPLLQDDTSPAPEGLAYVTEADFGPVHFVVYSRKLAPLDAGTVAAARNIEVEPGHESFFAFPVSVTHCFACTLDKILLSRADALIAPATEVDPLLESAKYKGIHRALFKSYPVRAVVPTKADSSATRRYLIDGLKQLKATGEFWRITHHDIPYSDWQP